MIQNTKETPAGIVPVSVVQKILDICRHKTAQDLLNRRRTWPQRFFLVWLAFNSGLKLNELAKLMFGNIDAETGTIAISGRTAQIINFDESIYNQYLSFRKNPGKDEYVFSNNGKKYTHRAIEISFRKAVSDAGITTPISIKDARNYYGYFLFSNQNFDDFISNMGCKYPACLQLHTNPKHKGVTLDYDLYVLYSQKQKAIKIGITKNIHSRLDAYSTHNSCYVEVLRFYKNQGNLESLLMKDIQDYRIKGEWFKETALSQVDSFMKKYSQKPSFVMAENFPQKQRNLFA